MPEVSIIIPLCNCLELTRACVASLEETIGHRHDFEVILVDNASTDGTSAWLATLAGSRYRVIRNATNRGYAPANNAAAEIAQGKYLLLLNNDTVLLPGWLDPILRVLKRAPRAGVVGNVQRDAESGLIDHVGVRFTHGGYPLHAGKGDVAPPTEEYARWPAVTAACCAISRDLFARLGGFDEKFVNGYEDIDLCLKAGAVGYRNYVANRSVIYHHISATPGRSDKNVENFDYFSRRWGRLLSARLAIHLVGRQRQFALVEERALADFVTAEERRLHEHGRVDGWRYLQKHALRPWHYNARRFWQALRGILAALPRGKPDIDVVNLFE